MKSQHLKLNYGYLFSKVVAPSRAGVSYFTAVTLNRMVEKLRFNRRSCVLLMYYLSMLAQVSGRVCSRVRGSLRMAQGLESSRSYGQSMSIPRRNLLMVGLPCRSAYVTGRLANARSSASTRSTSRRKRSAARNSTSTHSGSNSFLKTTTMKETIPNTTSI